MQASQSRRQRFLQRGARGLAVTTNKPQPPPSLDSENVSPSTRSSATSSSRGSNASKSSDRFRFGRLRRPHSKSSSASSLSSPAELRLQLMPRIAKYKSRGILSAQEEQTYMMLLERQDESSALQVERLLDQAKQQYDARHPQKKSDSGRRLLRKLMTGSNKHTSIHTTTNSTPGVVETELPTIFRSSSNVMVKEEEMVEPAQARSPPRLSSSSSSMDSTTKSIVETQDVWDSQIVRNEHELENIFVEMCFFARLGFVQPPCCLQCVYEESMEKKEASAKCDRWVVWRKNARTLLHPSRLDENLVLVKCHAARRLIDGEAVESHEWDSVRRQLVYHM